MTNYYIKNLDGTIKESSGNICAPLSHWNEEYFSTEEDIVTTDNGLMLKSDYDAYIQTDEYKAQQKQQEGTLLFIQARECIEKLLIYKLIYPAQAQIYQAAIDERYAKLDLDLAQLDGEQ